MTLVEFLLARIAEDEAVARAVPEVEPKSSHSIFTSLHEPTGTVEISPARVLAECEAKRRIVERASVECVCTDHGADRVEGCGQCLACQAVTTADGYVLADLALPHADHPDYRDEWRP